MARQQRYGGHLLLVVLDVDHFKRINDSFGHLAGDRVLKIIANELRKRLRKTDFIARFGGEEFALLLPETPLEAGLPLIDGLRAGIQACPFHFKGARLEVTLSGASPIFASVTAPRRCSSGLIRRSTGPRATGATESKRPDQAVWTQVAPRVYWPVSSGTTRKCPWHGQRPAVCLSHSVVDPR